MFGLISDRQLPIEALDDDRLVRLLEYWTGKKGDRIMPERSDIDPLELKEHMGQLHLIDVLGPNSFRYRIYGSRVTNPDLTDMTGKSASDYHDTAIAAMTTRHYQCCADARAPVFHHIVGEIELHRYEYKRLCLPLSKTGEDVDMILASPIRLVVPSALAATGRFEDH